jgi:hypothetical protein
MVTQTDVDQALDLMAHAMQTLTSGQLERPSGQPAAVSVAPY